jgi:hypothetical protein
VPDAKLASCQKVCTVQVPLYTVLFHRSFKSYLYLCVVHRVMDFYVKNAKATYFIFVWCYTMMSFTFLYYRGSMECKIIRILFVGLGDTHLYGMPYFSSTIKKNENLNKVWVQDMLMCIYNVQAKHFTGVYLKNCLVARDISYAVRNLKTHLKCPLLVPICSWLNPIHIFSCFFFEDAKHSKLSLCTPLSHPREWRFNSS